MFLVRLTLLKELKFLMRGKNQELLFPMYNSTCFKFLMRWKKQDLFGRTFMPNVQLYLLQRLKFFIRGRNKTHLKSFCSLCAVILALKKISSLCEVKQDSFKSFMFPMWSSTYFLSSSSLCRGNTRLHSMEQSAVPITCYYLSRKFKEQ